MQMQVINKLKEIEFNNNFIKKHETMYNTLFMRKKKSKVQDKVNSKDNIINKLKETIFIHDNMFWFIFIMLHSYDEYIHLKKQNVVERDLRYNLIDKVKKEKDLLKINKIKVNEIVNDLGSMMSIDMMTFKALCICLGFNCCLKNKKICEVMKNNDSTFFYVIEKNKMFLDKIDYGEIKNNYYIVNNLNKPFYSISKYKVNELKELCIRFGLLTLDEKESNKKLKKNDYYLKLKEYIS